MNPATTRRRLSLINQPRTLRSLRPRMSHPHYASASAQRPRSPSRVAPLIRNHDLCGRFQGEGHSRPRTGATRPSSAAVYRPVGIAFVGFVFPVNHHSIMATAFVIDRYYLTITFLITLAWQCLGFFIAWTFQVSHLLDDTLWNM